MDAWFELKERCARRESQALGGLSPNAYHELEQAINNNPTDYVKTNDEKALLILARALDRVMQERKNDDMLDDAAFEQEHERRMKRLAGACEQALELDKDCLDARTVRAIARHASRPDDLLSALLRLEDEYKPLSTSGVDPAKRRAESRLMDAAARSCLDTGRIQMTITRCQTLIEHNSTDEIGAHLTLSLASARMENEDALDALDAQFKREGNTWMNLSRTLLLYKLNRLNAARRALSEFDRSCEGAAYALLRPTFVDCYLPDRPRFKAKSFQEALLAMHEADPAVSDTPDFVGWATEQPSILTSAQQFAHKNGLEW